MKIGLHAGCCSASACDDLRSWTGPNAGMICAPATLRADRHQTPEHARGVVFEHVQRPRCAYTCERCLVRAGARRARVNDMGARRARVNDVEKGGKR